MENQDKLYELFKSASEKSETKDFSAMDKVWSRVEDKLDTVVIKKRSQVWKKLAVAASILLVISVGYQIFKTDEIIVNTTNPIVVKDKVITKTNEAVVIVEKQKPVVSEKNDDINYEKAEEVLSAPTSSQNSVGFANASTKAADELAKPEQKTTESQEESRNFQNQNSRNVASSNQNTFYPRSRKFESNSVQRNAAPIVVYDADVVKEVAQDKKLDPLYVVDGMAIQNSKAKKMKESLAEKSNDNDDNEFEKIVELKEPLYIINGNYYSELELFGPNPTSPYSPLNKQDIETISILQSDVATPIYGKKGEKGVVIIKTKNGKPAVISKKE